jgi:hypothetical protein
MQVGDIVTHITKGWYGRIVAFQGRDYLVKHVCSMKGNPTQTNPAPPHAVCPRSELELTKLPKSYSDFLEAEARKAEHNRPRSFSDTFKVGDRVRIIRHDHGWCDGDIVGTLISLGGLVEDGDGYTYEINHPRDIYHD